MSVHCSLVANALALLYVIFCVFITFPCGVRGQAWYLIVSIPGICHLPYFKHICHHDVSTKVQISVLFLMT